MCHCVAESRQPPRQYSDQWLNDAGRVVHPSAPLGVGGPGAFRAPGVFASDTSHDELLPHPLSPAVKTVDPSLVRQADELETAKVVRQPPPKVTTDSSETIHGNLTLTLKKDATGVAGLVGAITDFTTKNSGGVNYKADDKNIVTSITNTTKYVIEIQTRYGSGTPEGDSAYGRGTTKADKEAGNVTLGFHESCHREDMLTYFRNTPPPVLEAKVKQPETEVQQKIQAYLDAWDAYYAKIRALSVQNTDEVGDPTLSQFDAAQ